MPRREASSAISPAGNGGTQGSRRSTAARCHSRPSPSAGLRGGVAVARGRRGRNRRRELVLVGGSTASSHRHGQRCIRDTKRPEWHLLCARLHACSRRHLDPATDARRGSRRQDNARKYGQSQSSACRGRDAKPKRHRALHACGQAGLRDSRAAVGPATGEHPEVAGRARLICPARR